MKHNIFLSAALLASLSLCSCSNDVENIELQDLTTYDEQYYQNLRAFHASDHEVSYAYYEAWSPVEGVAGYKDPASWGDRMIGLPDSIDIVNLWMGVPSDDPNAGGEQDFSGCTYAPVAYADMKICQEKKGIRFVMHADASNYRHKFTVDGVEWDMAGNGNVSDEMMAAYAKSIYRTVEKGTLDGVDVDYEGWSGNNLTRLIKELANYMGPKSPNPDKLLIIDFFNSTPPSECADYCDYVVYQNYSNQTGGGMHVINGWPTEKAIYCETFGVHYNTGGKLLDYARWEPGDGRRKGGCGVFFLGRNYYGDNTGIPYYSFRRAIQIMNPALHK